MQEKIYDNSNIAESYAGATTPLTFSFVRYVYQEVYQHFSEMMGVKKELIKKNKHTFEHMVEFIGYRIYYNLNSWYKMLSFFPGYRFSGEFMEKMMGVEKHQSINKKEERYNFFSKYFIYFPKTILQVIKISSTFLFLKWSIPRFNNYFDKIFIKFDKIDINKLNLKELKRLYKEADDKFLSRWRVPIANDFAVMVSAGLADKLFKKWLNSNNAYSHMRVATNKPLITLDPGNRVLKIANHIKEDEKIRELFLDRHVDEIMILLHDRHISHKVTREVDTYLKEFGVRMPNELKLESETLTENPNNFIALLKKIVQSEQNYTNTFENQITSGDYQNLSLIRVLFLKWLLRWAGNSIRRREEARFRRTLIFGFIRKIFISIGKKMQQEKIIKNDRDMFFLSVEEVFDIISGQKRDLALSLVIEQRKQQFTKWQNIELPRRYETFKSIPGIEQELLDRSIDLKNKSDEQLVGRVASCPNKMQTFSGLALTLKNFDPTADFEGKILVTCQTDPGWTIIFPLLKGIVVERGGMLSHAAIVARELNIPCIVGVQQATDIIPSGMKITLDLQNGLIEKIC